MIAGGKGVFQAESGDALPLYNRSSSSWSGSFAIKSPLLLGRTHPGWRNVATDSLNLPKSSGSLARPAESGKPGCGQILVSSAPSRHARACHERCR